MIVLSDCAVTVSNAKQAAQWWTEKLGFAVHTVGQGGHAVMVAPPGDKFVLHLCEGFGPVEPGNSGVGFVTDELEPLVARMQASGVRFAEPLTKTSWGGFAKFEDPDGNVYWLMGAAAAFVRAEGKRRAPGRAAPRRPGGRRKNSSGRPTARRSRT
jgi:lactoylglutathione lyase